MSIVLDLAILFGLVGGIIWCMRRGALRTLISIGILFLSTLFAALLYNPLINFFTASLGNPSSGQTAGAIVFGGLMVVFVVVLEAVIRRNYPGLQAGKGKLGVWDNILGAILGLIWAMYLISIILLTLEYGSRSIGGGVTAVGEWISQSFLTPLFRAFFTVPLLPIRALFQGNMPQVLLYFTK